MKRSDFALIRCIPCDYEDDLEAFAADDIEDDECRCPVRGKVFTPHELGSEED